MTDAARYNETVLALIEKFANALPVDTYELVRRVAWNGEEAEAMLALAWAIHEGAIYVAAADRREIVSLAEGHVAIEDFPLGFTE